MQTRQIFIAAFIATIVVLSSSRSAEAQLRHVENPSTDALAAMVGDWEGDAWAMTRNGRMSMWQTEHVEQQLGGAILVVEGVGRTKSDSGEIGDVLFNAFAVIAPTDSSSFRMTSWLMDGNSGEFIMTPTETGRVWTIPTPYGTTRYTQEITAEGEWYEYGEFTRDEGKTWTRIMEMRLRKVSDR